MSEFYAQPYSLDHTGFYFNSLETFEHGMKKLNARGCEEVEIQFINGDDHLAELANNIQIYRNTIDFWFNEQQAATSVHQASTLREFCVN